MSKTEDLQEMISDIGEEVERAKNRCFMAQQKNDREIETLQKLGNFQGTCRATALSFKRPVFEAELAMYRRLEKIFPAPQDEEPDR